MAQPIDIIRLTDVRASAIGVQAAMDAIFYETAPRAPSDPAKRSAFHDLWLGQYVRHEPHLAHVACSQGQVVGYLVGCHVNPAMSPRFASLPYFEVFASACDRYPAHLHINLTAAARGRGTGAQLIDACIRDAAAARLDGVHVVTSAAARNVGFYQRNGFVKIDVTDRKGESIVFLGRSTKL